MVKKDFFGGWDLNYDRIVHFVRGEGPYRVEEHRVSFFRNSSS